MPSGNFQFSEMQLNNKNSNTERLMQVKEQEYHLHRSTKGSQTQSGSSRDGELEAQGKGPHKRPGKHQKGGQILGGVIQGGGWGGVDLTTGTKDFLI